MKKDFIIICAMGLMLAGSCVEKDTRFTLTENQVGRLASTSAISELDGLFATDSIVRDTLSALGSSRKKISVYEKGGKELLMLTANTDSIPTIETVQVLDERYTTEMGISLKSTFKDIQTAYPGSKIVTTVNSIVVFPKGSNLYFTIDKEELPASLRYNNAEIDVVQIPDEAKIKYLMLAWD